jgi:hypothetical protein
MAAGVTAWLWGIGDIVTMLKEEHTMTRDEKIQRIIERAIQSAFIDFPDAGNGEMWPQNYKEPNECKTVATAILSALKNAGYKITLESD